MQDAENVYLTFGKFKGKSVADVLATDPRYFNWIAEQTTMPYPWKDVAEAVLANRSLTPFINQRPTPEPAHNETTGVRTATLTMAENGRVILRYAYNKMNPSDVRFKDEIKRHIDGLKWEPEPHFRWTLPVHSIGKAIEAFGGKKNIYASDDVKDAYKQEMSRHQVLDEIRKKTDSDIEINTIIPLRPYQKVAAEFVDRAGGRALIADAPGVGKTATAIGYAILHNAKTLIACPKSVVINWEREIMRFAGVDACVWASKGPLGDITAQFHIVNYDITERFIKEFNELKFDLLVCDEATYIKNYKAKRTKAIMGSWKERNVYPGINTAKLILLTGTPILNTPLEAFQLLRFLSKDRFNNILKFREQYGQPGEKPRNLDDLHRRMKDLMIRRKKSEVLTEMPAKQRDDLVVELTPAATKQYNKVLDGIFRQWNVLGRPSAAQMPAIQKFLMSFKLERAFEFIDEMIENGESVLVFSQYRDPVLQIQKRYGKKCGIIMGGMDSSQRQRTVDGLKNKHLQVGAMTITAAGMGIDGIQYGVSTVLFLDRFWHPSVHEQAEDRVHRSGQTEPVQIYYLTCKGTIDEDMAAVLAEKQELIDKAVDGEFVQEVRKKSFFQDFIKRIKQRKYPQLQELSEAVDDADDYIFTE